MAWNLCWRFSAAGRMYTVSFLFAFFRDFPARSVVKFHTYVVIVASCFYFSWIYCCFPSSRFVFDAFCYVFWLESCFVYVTMSRSDILALCSDWPTASAAAVCARLRELGIWAPCRPIRSADAVRVVRRRGCRAGRRVNTFRLSRPLSAAPRPSSEPGNTVPLSRPSCFDITATVTTTDSGNHVHFGCLNICSWNNKFDDVVELISDLDLSVLCLTETWLDEDSPVVNRCRSSGFSVIDHPRSRSRDDLSVNHGGVAIVGAPGLSLSPLNTSRASSILF